MSERVKQFACLIRKENPLRKASQLLLVIWISIELSSIVCVFLAEEKFMFNLMGVWPVWLIWIMKVTFSPVFLIDKSLLKSMISFGNRFLTDLGKDQQVWYFVSTFRCLSDVNGFYYFMKRCVLVSEVKWCQEAVMFFIVSVKLGLANFPINLWSTVWWCSDHSKMLQLPQRNLKC